MNEAEELKNSIEKLFKIADILKVHTYELLNSRIEYLTSDSYIAATKIPIPGGNWPDARSPYVELEHYIQELKNIDIFTEVLNDISSILYIEEVKEVIEEKIAESLAREY